jgi:DNA polymerase-4
MKNILWKKPLDYQYLFLDMNAYFASIEQQIHPQFRKKPLVVTPTPCPTGCIVTASYEARSYGIKTGMTIREAQSLYPKIIIRSSDTFLYLKFHQKLLEIIKNITPFYYVKSIDELAIKLTPQDQNYQKSINFALKIKYFIKKYLGDHIRCSIGIAPNIFLAKMAAESKKPDGLTVLKKSNLKKFFSKLQLTDLCGIAHRMANNLQIININSPLDFFSTDIQKLKSQLGKIGEYWYLNLHGYDTKQTTIHIPAKTVSQSHVLEPKLRNWDSAWSVCEKLIFKAARRLRSNKQITKKILLKTNFTGGNKYKNWIKISPTNDSFTLTKYIKLIWKLIPKYTNIPLKINISFFDLSPSNPRQNKLFYDNKKHQSLSDSIDKINHRFSHNTIYPANTLQAQDSAPDRISFGQPKF